MVLVFDQNSKMLHLAGGIKPVLYELKGKANEVEAV